jgi:hypothetical protein
MYFTDHSFESYGNSRVKIRRICRRVFLLTCECQVPSAKIFMRYNFGGGEVVGCWNVGPEIAVPTEVFQLLSALQNAVSDILYLIGFWYL